MTRVFVALFDYDPMSMSPNPDAADEELPFKEGQIIKVGRFFDGGRVGGFTWCLASVQGEIRPKWKVQSLNRVAVHS